MRRELQEGDRVRIREAEEESIEGLVTATADEDGFVVVRWSDEGGETCEAEESTLEVVPGLHAASVRYEHPVLAPWRF